MLHRIFASTSCAATLSSLGAAHTPVAQETADVKATEELLAETVSASEARGWFSKNDVSKYEMSNLKGAGPCVFKSSEDPRPTDILQRILAFGNLPFPQCKKVMIDKEMQSMWRTYIEEGEAMVPDDSKDQITVPVTPKQQKWVIEDVMMKLANTLTNLVRVEDCTEVAEAKNLGQRVDLVSRLSSELEQGTLMYDLLEPFGYGPWNYENKQLERLGLALERNQGENDWPQMNAAINSVASWASQPADNIEMIRPLLLSEEAKLFLSAFARMRVQHRNGRNRTTKPSTVASWFVKPVVLARLEATCPDQYGAWGPFSIETLENATR